MSPSIGLLVFPGIQILDLAGPYEVFRAVPDATLHLLWKDRAPVMSAGGLPFAATATFAEAPALDVLCVPGGAGVNRLMTDAAVLDFLRATAARTPWLSSVCTGALLLGAAGLLRGRRATTHWNSHDFLAAFGAEPVDQRVVRDGNLFTAAGVTSGIDLALAVVDAAVGRERAEEITLAFEYAPQPPFAGGTLKQAPPAAIAAARERYAASRREREAIVASLRA
ncbi:DJ-1/PfpI family protein [Rhodoplanes sp. TEM]|uniref:DJ-1/PfpI family protein n=1 Tax=Rhodoplanes tepidamans TaxID=200616 RepID=A0ABT5JHK8_RHOTP|nr:MULTISPECIES: DJ-1/PfpI family protein [Rhodoplanes]MDC7789059.1 DJ-1/PfpI family protein [Rhodoplanes tepidamans]MDC7982486.1 DJ-1/PfpI family protein [Rhodoplanes sp. TEM]MDQ0354942.1 cyclohexyl-isocyanide hydratase [Rhodoplanes tepidamans]